MGISGDIPGDMPGIVSFGVEGAREADREELLLPPKRENWNTAKPIRATASPANTYCFVLEEELRL
jgi:hypothetical protein